ncbi:MAG TPA: DUF4185 domain-containing protein [Rhizomicrobium sp.]|nr:DUF4185 domain-containing protein [Rhizomicrobium sp.]
MKLSHAVVLAVIAAGIGTGAGAGTLTVSSPSAKVCQLTGQTDWASNQPTAAQTMANFGLDSVDLGFPIESNPGPLYFLFGDAFPLTHSFSSVPPDDALGWTTRTAQPDSANCLDLQLAAFAPKTVAHPTVTPAIQQGSFNVPSGGLFLDGTIYAFFWTNHCVLPGTLLPNSSAPLQWPAPTAACAQIPANNSVGSSVLAAASPADPIAFHRCGYRERIALLRCPTMPSGFVYVTAAQPPRAAREILARAENVYVFGVPRYRASIPYLAIAPRATFSDTNTWSFFAGRNPGGNPIWISRAQWESGKNAMGQWTPPAGAEVYDATPGERCVGEHQVTWNSALGTWLLLYNCAPWTIEARTAALPWGPWSPPTVLLQATPASPLVCTLIMSVNGCPGLRNYWPPGNPPGIFYAPFILSRYTQDMTVAGSPARSATIYWVLSTWNPYQVTVMQTGLQFVP